jgi:Bacteriocin-protection, YdeI or OmpD-Associated
MKQVYAWGIDPRPVISMDIPKELSEAIARNRKAKDFFETLAPSYQKHFIGWIVTAKREETKARRLKQSLALLARREKLGLKLSNRQAQADGQSPKQGTRPLTLTLTRKGTRARATG